VTFFNVCMLINCYCHARFDHDLRSAVDMLSGTQTQSGLWNIALFGFIRPQCSLMPTLWFLWRQTFLVRWLQNMYTDCHVCINLARCEMKHVSVDTCRHCDFCGGNISRCWLQNMYTNCHVCSNLARCEIKHVRQYFSVWITGHEH